MKNLTVFKKNVKLHLLFKFILNKILLTIIIVYLKKHIYIYIMGYALYTCICITYAKIIYIFL